MLSNHPNCLGGNGPSASSDLIGDVDGPASATDNAVARFDGTTGKLIQNSAVTIDDSGNITPTGSVHAAAGSVGNPSLAFNVDQNTGLYNIGPNNIGVAANGAKVLDIATTGLTVVGAVNVADGTAAAPSISFSADTDTGLYRSAANTVSVSVGGARGFDFSGSGFTLRGVPILGTDSIAITAGGTNKNITLTPSGTGTVVSTNVNFDVTSSLVTAEVYCTAAFSIGRGGSIALGGLVDGSNSSTFAAIAGQKESAVSGATGGYLGLFTRANGAAMTERARILSTGRFLLGTITDSGALLQIGTNTTANTGGMVFGTDTFLYRVGNGNIAVAGTTNPAFNYYAGSTLIGYCSSVAGSMTIATAGAGSPSLILKSGNEVTALTLDSSQNATFAGYISTAAAGRITFTGRARLESPVDGVLSLYNAAASDFTRLQFGGTTSSFPALKRNSATLEAKLADDSAYTNFAASRYYNGSTNVFWAFGTGSPEGVVSASVGSIYSRTDGGAVTSFYVKETGSGNTGWVAK